MVETEALIERIWQVSPGVQRIELSVDPACRQIQPGQLLLTLANDTWNPYLREIWIPVDLQQEQVVVELHTDTPYTPGQVVNLLGPVGEGLPWLSGGNKHLLLIAQDTPPTPLLMLAQEAVRQTAEVALVLLGDAVNYPFAGIPAAVEVINGDENEAWQDQAATINWADQIFAVVNDAFWQDNFTTLFHTIQQARGHIHTNFFYGIFTIPLPCGTGACAACMIRCKTSTKFVCRQGPALDLTEVQLS